MLEDFLSYIESNLSVFRKDKLLLSVSGGVDSMVMLHLFRMLEYNFSVAHINHSTRNGESNADMSFVAEVCKTFNIPFYSTTLDYDRLNKGNFQENARNERFDFLTQLQEKHAFKWIATAHHLEDRWETFLMHLNRKSGIQGLTSLRPKENSVIHPMLIFTKEQINNFAKSQNIEFVYDKSNDSNDYLRNSIRNNITPVIKQVLPDFIKNVNHSIQFLDEENKLLNELIANMNLISKEETSGNSLIDLDKIRTFTNSHTLLSHLIETFGFNHSDARDMLKSKTTGAIFQSKAFEALQDRGILIIRKKVRVEKNHINIPSLGTYELPNKKHLHVDQENVSETDSSLWLDINKIKWPLTVRSILPGDKFKPAGMKGASKSIKKLCTDLKISRFAKEDLLVVCQKDTIIQVIGLKTSLNYGTVNVKNAVTFKIVV